MYYTFRLQIIKKIDLSPPFLKSTLRAIFDFTFDAPIIVLVNCLWVKLVEVCNFHRVSRSISNWFNDFVQIENWIS